MPQLPAALKGRVAMPKSLELFHPRGPRHLSAEGEQATVELRRLAEQPHPDHLARPADISRTGMHLVLSKTLAIGATAFVTLRDSRGDAVLAREGKVQWARVGTDQRWHVGVEFTTQLDWETLGELFLRNILNAEAAR
jgi:hypothetical protein